MSTSVYIDPLIGDDSNSGDGNHPFQHLPGAYNWTGSYTASEDDTWNLCPGSHSLVGSDLVIDAVDGITLQAAEEYNAKPVLLGKVSMLTATWTDTGGNIWTTPWSYDPTRLFLDDTGQIFAASAGAVDATDRWFWAANVLYLYSTSDPSTNYASIDITANTKGLKFRDCDGASLLNIEVQGFLNAQVYVDVYAKGAVRGFTSRGCDLYDAALNTRGYMIGLDTPTVWARPISGILLEDFDVDTRLVAHEDRDVGHGSGNGISFRNHIGLPGAQPEGDGATVRNGTVNAFTHACLTTSQVYSAGGMGQGFRNILWDNIECDNGGSSYCRAFGIGGPNTHNVIMRRILSKNMTVRNQFGGSDGLIEACVFDTTVSSIATPDVHEGLSFNSYDNAPSTGYMEQNRNTVRGCVFKDIGREAIRMISSATAPYDPRGLSLENIIVQDCGGDHASNYGLSLNDASGFGTVRLRGLQWYSSGTMNLYWRGTSYGTAAAAAAAEAEISLVQDGDPLLQADYSVASGSPCKDIGASTRFTDYSGGERTGRCDIGAYSDNYGVGGSTSSMAAALVQVPG